MSGCTSSPPAFFTLNTAESWRRGDLKNLEAAPGGLRLTTSGQHELVDILTAGQLPTPFQPSALALGSCSLLYLLDPKRTEVWRCDSALQTIEPFRRLDGLLEKPTGLAAFGLRLIGGSASGAVRLAVLDAESGQIHWTAGGAIVPAAIGMDPTGGCLVLDSSGSQVLHFAVDGALLETIPIPASAGSRLTSICRDRAANLFVLDRGLRRILKRPLGGAFAILVQLDFDPAALAVGLDGTLLVGEPSQAPPAVTAGDRRRLWRFNAGGESLGTVSAYTGPADVIAAGARGVFVFRAEDRRLVHLTTRSSFLKPLETPPPKGEYYSPVFDSTRGGTEWHRILLNADLPVNTLVQARWFASDTLDAPVGNANMAWSGALVNPFDALLLDAKGRYLWLHLRLIGTEKETPVVRSLEVHFPRVSYLRYLPAIYQEDPQSREFLSRFLSLYESFFAGIERQTDVLPRYFDPVAVPVGFLEWLASWLSLEPDPAWTPDRIRRYLIEAPELYKRRGTRSGIERMVEIYSGEKPFIVEQHSLSCAQDAEILDVYRRLYGGDPFCFCVLLRPMSAPGSAAKGHLAPGWETPTTPPLSPSGVVELLIGDDVYHIALGAANHLEGLRDAVKQLDAGVRARVARLPSNPRLYTLDIRARRIGPLALGLRLEAGNSDSDALVQTDAGSLPRFVVRSEEDRAPILRMLAAEKPAHTCAGLHVLEPRILLDMHSYLEVNSFLSHPAPLLDRGAAIPLDSVLADRSSQGRVETHARVNLDAELG